MAWSCALARVHAQNVLTMEALLTQITMVPVDKNSLFID